MIATRLTARLGIRHPVIQAPMAFAAGGALAAAVSRNGGTLLQDMVDEAEALLRRAPNVLSEGTA